MLTALAQTFAQRTGPQALLVDLEGPGRGGLFEDVDLSRTVGWLTNLFPVRLDLGEMRGPGEALMVVKEQLRAIPKQGIGYGLLRYLQGDEEMADRLRALAQAEVSFSYLGQLDQVLDEESPFGPLLDLQDSQERRNHSLNISGVIVEGRLQVDWRYSEATYRRETVEHVAGVFIRALRAITAHCQSPEAIGYTPSDFPDLDLSQEEIEALVAEIGGDL